MDEIQRSLIKVFLEEAGELMAELEQALLELEGDPGDLELVGRVFRALHTIKGNGAMFGFTRASGFTHELESAFALVREGRMSVTQELIDITLRARDRISAMIAAGAESDQSLTPDDDEVLDRLRALVGTLDGGEDGRDEADPAHPEAEDGTAVTYRIRFRPQPGLFACGANPLALLRELGDFGACEVVAHLDRVPPLAELDPQSCLTWWDVILTTDRGLASIREAFLFVEGRSEISIEVIDAEGMIGGGEYKRLGEILVENGDLPREALDEILGGHQRIGEKLVDRGLLRPAQVESALAEQVAVRDLRQKRAQEETMSSVRVDSFKLDDLVNLVGEMVTVQARLSRTAGTLGDAGLTAIAEDVERLTAELRDNAFNIRMVPIGTTFTKFRRLVRDLAREMGKEAELVTEGAETELDKNVIERLHDPLVHLIRNALGHGLEAPELRAASGKPRRGTINLSASHSGAYVVIRVRDDGAGLDLAAVRARAVERGILAGDAAPGERELASLVFAPGFSTARELTSLSGRGVGLDVVKRFVEALRGSVDIASEPGQGTAVTIRLPLTLAIIEGLQVRVGEERFILPLSVVQECVELTRKDREEAHGKPLATLRGELVPYVRMREVFGIGGDAPEREQIVIADLDGRKVGFAVDFVVGEHQTVIKSLGKVFRGAEGVSGATILGDGSVALILEAPELVRLAEDEEAGLFR